MAVSYYINIAPYEKRVKSRQSRRKKSLDCEKMHLLKFQGWDNENSQKKNDIEL